MSEIDIPKKKRTEAMIRAQKKYYNKIKNEFPEKYRERNKQYAKKQYEKNKEKPEFMENNRQNVKKYYDSNKELISQKRKDYYKNNRDKILQRQKIARDKRKELNKNIEHNNNDIDK
jgi:hypothetical protein